MRHCECLFRRCKSLVRSRHDPKGRKEVYKIPDGAHCTTRQVRFECGRCLIDLLSVFQQLTATVYQIWWWYLLIHCLQSLSYNMKAICVTSTEYLKQAAWWQWQITFIPRRFTTTLNKIIGHVENSNVTMSMNDNEKIKSYIQLQAYITTKFHNSAL